MPHCQTPELSLAAVHSSPVRPAADDGRHPGVAGPGWFDSSWELQRGLEVQEGWFGDDRLSGWIESFLAAQRSATGRTASPRSSTAIA
ncbi:MAG: hypothetical protein ACXWUL_10310 [Caldimonas sp.]